LSVLGYKRAAVSPREARRRLRQDLVPRCRGFDGAERASFAFFRSCVCVHWGGARSQPGSVSPAGQRERLVEGAVFGHEVRGVRGPVRRDAVQARRVRRLLRRAPLVPLDQLAREPHVGVGDAVHALHGGVTAHPPRVCVRPESVLLAQELSHVGLTRSVLPRDVAPHGDRPAQ
jgi:hypothetical protein